MVNIMPVQRLYCTEKIEIYENPEHVVSYNCMCVSGLAATTCTGPDEQHHANTMSVASKTIPLFIKDCSVPAK